MKPKACIAHEIPLRRRQQQFVGPIGLASLALLCCRPAVAEPPDSPHGVQITRLPDRLRVEVNGQLFTEYYFKDVPRPYCYPLLGPGGRAMTRNWPVKNVPGEEHDHRHHRSLWFAHGLINGYDFWSEAKNAGRTLHEDFIEITSGKDAGIIRSRNKWVTAEGNEVLTDDRKLTFFAPRSADERTLDFEITLHASKGDLVFGDTKEGSMAVRVAESMKLKQSRADVSPAPRTNSPSSAGRTGRPPYVGHIITSASDQDDRAWGKRADWCDYSGPVDAKLVGIAMFDHPKNPRHPTWWHVRDYGLFAANPFGKHDFEKLSDTNAGNLTLPAGQSLTFQYRIILHTGDAGQADIAGKYGQYISSSP